MIILIQNTEKTAMSPHWYKGRVFLHRIPINKCRRNEGNRNRNSPVEHHRDNCYRQDPLMEAKMSRWKFSVSHLSECEVARLCLTLRSHGLYLPGSSVHGIFLARVLEWVAISFSRGSFLTQGSNLRLLHWQADPLPLSHLESPREAIVEKSSDYEIFLDK